VTLSIRDKITDKLVRVLAQKKRLGLTEAVRLAVTNELDRMEQEAPLRDRIAAIRRTVTARGRTGEVADKTFFDDLGGNL
jgi:antitoxin VapB